MKKKKKLDTIIIGTFIYVIMFVTIGWVTYWIKGDVPESLIQYGLGGGVLELVLSASIEIFSNKRRGKDE